MEGIVVGRPERRPGAMHTADLDKLERVARNMPFVGKLTLANAAEDRLGIIYMAWGKNAACCYLGLWGARGFGRTIEFLPAIQDEKKVRDTLMADAVQVLEGMQGAGMLDVGWWNARH